MEKGGGGGDGGDEVVWRMWKERKEVGECCGGGGIEERLVVGEVGRCLRYGNTRVLDVTCRRRAFAIAQSRCLLREYFFPEDSCRKSGPTPGDGTRKPTLQPPPP